MGIPTNYSSINGRYFQDENQNGFDDNDQEQAVADVCVYLYDVTTQKVIASTNTDANGNYSFGDLPAGQYRIGFEADPNGSGFITGDPIKSGKADYYDSDVVAINSDGYGYTDIIELSEGDNRYDVDAGSLPNGDGGDPMNASISDRLWIDSNKDGLRDNNEDGAVNVTVNLKNAAGVVVATQQTDADGKYTFSGLAAGDYSIEVTSPDGYSFTKQDVQGNSKDGRDSDVDADTGNTHTITLEQSENVANISAGLIPDEVAPATSTISDRVWIDTDKDGLQDADEVGAANVTVHLKDADGTILESTTTDSNGTYTFDKLEAGSYAIGVEAPDEYRFTEQDASVTTDNNRTLTVDTSAEWQALGVRTDGLASSGNLQVGTGYATAIQGLTFNGGALDTDNDAYVEIPLGGNDHVEESVSVDLNVYKNWSSGYGGEGSAGAIFELVDADGNVLDSVDWSSQSNTVNVYSDATTTNDENIHLEGTGSGLYVRIMDQSGDNYWGNDWVLDSMEVTASPTEVTTSFDDIDSDVDQSTGMSDVFEVAEGETKSDIAAGLVQINEEPIAVDDHLVAVFGLGTGAYGSIDVTANDSDPDGDDLTIIDFEQPSIGTLTLGADGKTLSFAQPPHTAFPPQHVKYTVSDGNGGTAEATLTISWICPPSPIALDMNGDGEIGVTGETTSIEKKLDADVGRTVEFDIDADGDLDTIEWIDGSGDGLLVDLSKIGADNSIDGSALFGDEGGTYSNGYEKLALHDANDDGLISGEELEGLGLWIDDGDAVLEAGELQSAEEAGIASVSTTMEIVLDDEGRELMQSTATNTDGEEIMTEDVWFAEADNTDEIAADETVLQAEIDITCCDFADIA